MAPPCRHRGLEPVTPAPGLPELTKGPPSRRPRLLRKPRVKGEKDFDQLPQGGCSLVRGGAAASRPAMSGDAGSVGNPGACRALRRRSPGTQYIFSLSPVMVNAKAVEALPPVKPSRSLWCNPAESHCPPMPGGQSIIIPRGISGRLRGMVFGVWRQMVLSHHPGSTGRHQLWRRPRNLPSRRRRARRRGG